MNTFWREHRSNTATVFDFKAQNCSSFTIAHPFGEKMDILPIDGITLSSVNYDIDVLKRFEEANSNLSLCGKYKTESNIQRRGDAVSKIEEQSALAKIGGKHRKTKRRTKTKRHKKTTRKYKKYGKTRKHHKK